MIGQKVFEYMKSYKYSHLIFFSTHTKTIKNSQRTRTNSNAYIVPKNRGFIVGIQDFWYKIFEFYQFGTAKSINTYLTAKIFENHTNYELEILI